MNIGTIIKERRALLGISQQDLNRGSKVLIVFKKNRVGFQKLGYILHAIHDAESVTA